jgi:hypothetical protein
MRSVRWGGFATLGVLAAVTVFGGAPGWAQCTHLSGSPLPTANPALASKIRLRAASGGLFGDANDKFKILKGFLSTSGPIDPATTHQVHITLRKTNSAGPVMLAISLPPGPPWISLSGAGFRYLDPLAPLAVRKFLVKGISPQYFYKVIGKKASIASAPLTTGDTIHMMVEIESGGVGDCFDTVLPCTATTTAANCG